ncbi:MAG: hypothetical protein HS115_12600 [Spirochaetales bacterium]|nr:hypothetical protein [Spirochaetales bacterium]
MNPVVRNVLAIIVGFILGSAVNMGIIMIGGSVIPPPEGSDLATMEGLTAAMEKMTPIHFVMPFLAHALGTLFGASMAAFIGSGNKILPGIIVSIFFLCGGILNVILLPSPLWFSILDLTLAYLPMGWLGARFILKSQRLAIRIDNRPR